MKNIRRMVKLAQCSRLAGLGTTSHFIVKKERLMSDSNSTIKTLCCVDGCGRDATYKAACLCQKHYFRLRRNGDFKTHSPTARPRIEDSRGYQFLHAPSHPLVAKGQIYVAEHRMVLYEAIGAGPMNCELCKKPLTWESCCVDHIDENTRNNQRSNLRPTCNPCNGRRGKREAHEYDWTISLTFDGVTKTAHEWSFDPRVKVASNTIRFRKRAGQTDEQALFGLKKTHNGNPPIDKRLPKTKYKYERSNAVALTVNGETKTAAEWSRMPGVQVTSGGMAWRLKQGWPHERVVFQPGRAIKALYAQKTKTLKAIE